MFSLLVAIENVAVVDPAGMVTAEGNVKAVLVSVINTVRPPEGAGEESVIVALADCPDKTVEGLSVSELIGTAFSSVFPNKTSGPPAMAT